MIVEGTNPCSSMIMRGFRVADFWIGEISKHGPGIGENKRKLI